MVRLLSLSALLGVVLAMRPSSKYAPYYDFGEDPARVTTPPSPYPESTTTLPSQDSLEPTTTSTTRRRGRWDTTVELKVVPTVPNWRYLSEDPPRRTKGLLDEDVAGKTKTRRWVEELPKPTSTATSLPPWTSVTKEVLNDIHTKPNWHWATKQLLKDLPFPTSTPPLWPAVTKELLDEVRTKPNWHWATKELLKDLHTPTPTPPIWPCVTKELLDEVRTKPNWHWATKELLKDLHTPAPDAPFVKPRQEGPREPRGIVSVGSGSDHPSAHADDTLSDGITLTHVTTSPIPASVASTVPPSSTTSWCGGRRPRPTRRPAWPCLKSMTRPSLKKTATPSLTTSVRPSLTTSAPVMSPL